MTSKFLSVARFVVFSIASLLSLITLALSAHIVNFTNRVLSFYLDYAALGIAVSLLTLLTFPAMLYFGKAHPGTFPTFIVLEISWTGFLWIMWLAFAGSTANINPTGGMCSTDPEISGIPEEASWITFCDETNAIEAFGFFNWLMLLAYFGILLINSIMASQAGNKQIWTSSVNEAKFKSDSYQSYTLETSYQPAVSSPHNMTGGTQTVSQPPYATTQA